MRSSLRNAIEETHNTVSVLKAAWKAIIKELKDLYVAIR